MTNKLFARCTECNEEIKRDYPYGVVIKDKEGLERMVCWPCLKEMEDFTILRKIMFR